MIDALDQPYCCFNCAAKFRLGETLDAHCPQCRSGDIHPIEQGPVELKEYHGEIGTKN